MHANFTIETRRASKDSSGHDKYTLTMFVNFAVNCVIELQSPPPFPDEGGRARGEMVIVHPNVEKGSLLSSGIIKLKNTASVFPAGLELQLVRCTGFRYEGFLRVCRVTWSDAPNEDISFDVSEEEIKL